MSNTKAHLYRLLLQSLRLISDEDNIDIQLQEQLGFARILFNKGLYHQALRILEKMKPLAQSYFQYSYLQQALFFEKKIEALYITRSMESRARQLADESVLVNRSLDNISSLSDLSLQLYSWYIRNGHVRNTADEVQVKELFQLHRQYNVQADSSFYEHLYYYQAHCWLAFICQDFLQYYRYSRKWVDIFDKHPQMKLAETAYYLKGLHNLVGAHFVLRNYRQMEHCIHQLEGLLHDECILHTENNQIQVIVYLFTARINYHFSTGNFSSGLSLVPEIEAALEANKFYLDKHRVLVFYYKIACLYFGSGDNSRAIDYLNKIIHLKSDLRTDLQCYARLLHLIAHYELGNDEILEYLLKSVYRFMAGMKSLSVVEEEMFAFLHRSFKMHKKDVQQGFAQLLERLIVHENNRFETRAFLYLDIISWLQGKVERIPVQEVIRQKYLHSTKRRVE